MSIKVLDNISAGSSAHGSALLVILVETLHGCGQRRIVSRWDENPSLCCIYDLSNDTINREDRRAPSSHVVKDFVRIRGAKHWNIFQGCNASIRRSENSGYVSFRAGTRKGHVRQGQCMGLPFQIVPLLPITDQ